MQRLDNVKIEDLPGYESECGCGKIHKMETKFLYFRPGAIEMLAEVLNSIMPSGRVLLVSAKSEDKKLLEFATAVLRRGGYTVSVHIYGEEFHADVASIGRLFDCPEDTRAVVGIGTEGLLDAVKFFAALKKLPFVAVATSCMVGRMLSAKALLNADRLKQRFDSAVPYAVICDFDIISSNPKNPIAAMFGANMSYLGAMFDSYYSFCVAGQPYCDAILGEAERIIDNNIRLTDGLIRSSSADVIACMEYSLRLAALEQLSGGAFINSTAEVLASTYESVRRASGKSVRESGEAMFWLTKKAMELYKLFMKSPIRDLSYPPDKCARADRIAKLFALNAYDLFKDTDYDYEDYENRQMRINEYREDILSVCEGILEKSEVAAKTFKRLSPDMGYASLKYVNTEELKTAIGLAPDLFSDFTCLTSLRDMGLTDGLIR